MVDKIRIELDLDADRFTTNIDSAGVKLNRLGDEVTTASRKVNAAESKFKRFAKTMGKVVIVGGQVQQFLQLVWSATGQWTKAILDANGEIERLTALLSGLSDETDLGKRMEEASNEIAHFIDLAGKAPFTLQQLTASAVKFKSVGLDPLSRGFNSFVDSVAAFGGTDETLARASIAIQQMAGKGVISMEELRQQLGEAVPNAIQLMARSMGLGMRDFVDEVSNGRVSAVPAIEGMFREMERSFGGAAERMMNTWSGLNQALATEWQKFMLAIGQGGGFFDIAKESLSELTVALGSDSAIIFAQNLGEVLAVLTKIATAIAVFTIESAPAILEIAKALTFALGAGALAKVLKMAGGLAGLRTSFGFAAAGAAAFGTSMTGALAATGGVAGKFSALGTIAAGLGLRIKTLAAGFSAFGGVLGITLTIIASAAAYFYNASQSGKEALERLRDGGINTIDQLKDALDELDTQEALLETRRRGRNANGDTRSDAERANARISIEQDRALVMKEIRSVELAQAEKANALFKKLYDDDVDSIRARYRETADAISEQLNDKVITGEESSQQLVKAMKSQFIELNDIYNKQLSSLQATQNAISESDDPQRYKLLSDQIKSINEDKLDHVKAHVGDIEQQANRESAIRDLQIREGVSSLDSYVKVFEANAARSRDELAGVNGELSRFQFFLDSGKFEGLEKLLASEGISIDQYKQRLAASVRVIDAAKAAKANLTKVTGINTKIENLAVQQTEKLSQAMSKLDTDSTDSSNAIFSLQTRLAVMRKEFVKAGGDVIRFNESADDLVRTAKEASAIDFLAELTGFTTETQIEALNDYQKGLTEYQNKVSEIQKNSSNAINNTSDADLQKDIVKARNASLIALDREYHESKLDEVKSIEQQISETRISYLPLIEQEEASHKLALQNMERSHVDLINSIIDPELRVRAEAAANQLIIDEQRKFSEERISIMNDLRDAYQVTEQDIVDIATSGVDFFVDELSSGLADGTLNMKNFSESFSEFAEGVVEDIIKMMVQAALLKTLGLDTGGGLDASGSGIVGTLLTGLFSGFASGLGAPSITEGSLDAASTYGSTIAAKSLSSSPTFYGSGSFFDTSSSGGTGAIKEVTINNNGSAAQVQSISSDPSKEVLNIVLEGMNSPGSFRTSMKNS